MASFTQMTLSLLADVAKGRVRCDVRNDRPVTLISEWEATGTELEILKSLHLSGRIEPGEGGVYTATKAGLAYLYANFPTWA